MRYIDYIWLISTFSGIFILTILLTLRLYKKKTVLNRLYQRIAKKKKPYGKRLSGLINTCLNPIGKKLSVLAPSKIKKTMEEEINNSGIQLQLGSLLVLKIIFSCVFLVVVIFAAKRLQNPNLSFVLGFAAMILGFQFPDIYLTRKAKERKEKIWKALPEFIDYVVICVEAGLGLDTAILRVLSLISGPLAEEFAGAMTEIKYGKPKKEAFKKLTEKINVSEFTSFINSLINGEQFGISLITILRVQGQRIRDKRVQKMREEAYKAPVKLVFPLIIFILPTIFIVLLGPAVINMLDILFK